MGFEFVIEFTEHLQIITTSNYSAVTNSHTLQFTTAHTKSSQSAVDPSTSVVMTSHLAGCHLSHCSSQAELTGFQLPN
jgi:hypothetical protein